MSFSIEGLKQECQRILEEKYQTVFAGLTDFTVHYIAGRLTVQLVLRPRDPSMSVQEFTQVANEVQTTLKERLTDIQDVVLALDLHPSRTPHKFAGANSAAAAAAARS
jgi:divalent metal cation (Fe/Co/Zn/Cd) transporter